MLCQHSYWKWPVIVDFPMEHGWIFHSYVKLPEGNEANMGYERYDLWTIMNGFHIFFGEWNIFVFVLSWAFITYKLPNNGDISGDTTNQDPTKHQSNMAGHWEIPTIDESFVPWEHHRTTQGGFSSKPCFIAGGYLDASSSLLVSHAGIGLHIHIIHDFYLLEKLWPALPLRKVGYRWIVMKPTDTRDIPRLRFLGWLASHALFLGLLGRIMLLVIRYIMLYPNDIPMISQWYHHVFCQLVPSQLRVLSLHHFHSGESPSCP